MNGKQSPWYYKSLKIKNKKIENEWEVKNDVYVEGCMPIYSINVTRL